MPPAPPHGTQLDKETWSTPKGWLAMPENGILFPAWIFPSTYPTDDHCLALSRMGNQFTGFVPLLLLVC